MRTQVVDPDRKKYKLLITYDGTDYSGWQVQPNAPTIQEVLQKAAKTVLQTETHITGSGRTDAGVHALGQVAHFWGPPDLKLRRFLASMNGLLPPDIRIKEVDLVDENFHARYSAVAKTYFYHLFLAPVQDPFRRRYHLHISYPLDINLLEKAAAYFVGEHDFTSFANEPGAGSVAKNPVRTVKRVEVVREGEHLRLIFEANGFLYKMVRNITGLMLEVATGKRELSEIPKILAARDRRLSGRAAPPHPLFLASVSYRVPSK